MKKRTTVNLDDGLLLVVRDRGVKNLSGLLDKLLREWLRGSAVNDEVMSVKVSAAERRLGELEREWFAYVGEAHA